MENYMKNLEEKCKKEYFSNNKLPINTCPICESEFEPEEAVSLKCEHKMCKDCYTEYIKTILLTSNFLLYTACNVSELDST